LYYTVGGDESRLSNEEYDLLLDALRDQCPDDHRLTRVGAPYSADELRNKVEHTIPMGSLNNTDGGIDGFAEWYRWVVAQCDGGLPPLNLSLKMDGSSVAAYYENGELQCVVGRGNGEVGENLTANAVKWRHLPTSLPRGFTGVVRGEAMLYNEDFDTVNQENGTPPEEISNPRNVGNGIMGRTDGKQNQYIRYVAFNMVGDKIDTLTGKLRVLNQIGFVAVTHKTISTRGKLIDEILDEVRAYHDEIYEGRDGLPFGIDGIVACIDEVGIQNKLTRDRKDALRPRYARAIKFVTQKNETTVKGVTLTVGHTGAIIPTADLEPVRVGGVTVDSALLNNWNADSTNPTAAHVKIGDTVVVELAGDIIPKIAEVLVSPPDAQPIPEPAICPSCGAKTTREHRGKTGAVTYCSDPENCGAAAVYKIKHYVGSSKKGIGILGIGDGVLVALTDSGLVKTPADLYRLTVEQLENLEIGTNAKNLPIRLGRSRATGIVSEITKAKTIPLAKFLGALGVDLLGRRRVQILAEAHDLRTLADWRDPVKLGRISGDTMRESIIDGLAKAEPAIQELLDVGVIVEDLGVKPKATVKAAAKPEIKLHVESDEIGPKAEADDDPITGRTFCFTGTRAHIEEVEARGGIIKSNVSKGLDFLVQKDPTSSSNKTRKAEEYGTKIIGIATLEAVLKGERSLPA